MLEEQNEPIFSTTSFHGTETRHCIKRKILRVLSGQKSQEAVITICWNNHERLHGNLEAWGGLGKAREEMGRESHREKPGLSKWASPENYRLDKAAPGTVGHRWSCPTAAGPQDHGEEGHIMVLVSDSKPEQVVYQNKRLCSQMVKRLGSKSDLRSEPGFTFTDSVPLDNLLNLSMSYCLEP